MRLTAFSLLVLVACGPSSSDDTASASSTGAPSCEMYQSDADIGPSVAVTIRHEGSAPVFLDTSGCGGAPIVRVTSQLDGTVVPHLLDGCTPNTCQGYVEAPDCSQACDNCGEPSGARLEPGIATDTAWPGRWLRELELGEACAPAADCPATCMRDEQAPPGTYEIAVTVHRECSGSCECDDPIPTARCSLSGALEFADSVTLTATIDYPATTSVELVITD